MERTHSLVPVGPFTAGLPAATLRGLAERHAVSSEISPHAIAKVGAVVRHGWLVDLYGARSASDASLPPDAASHHVHEVLHALARAVLPAHATIVTATVEPYHGAVHLDPHRGMREEIRLRIVVEALTTARDSIVAGADTALAHEIGEGLRALGVRAR